MIALIICTHRRRWPQRGNLSTISCNYIIFTSFWAIQALSYSSLINLTIRKSSALTQIYSFHAFTYDIKNSCDLMAFILWNCVLNKTKQESLRKEWGIRVLTEGYRKDDLVSSAQMEWHQRDAPRPIGIFQSILYICRVQLYSIHVFVHLIINIFSIRVENETKLPSQKSSRKETILIPKWSTQRKAVNSRLQLLLFSDILINVIPRGFNSNIVTGNCFCKYAIMLVFHSFSSSIDSTREAENSEGDALRLTLLCLYIISTPE